MLLIPVLHSTRTKSVELITIEIYRKYSSTAAESRKKNIYPWILDSKNFNQLNFKAKSNDILVFTIGFNMSTVHFGVL